MTKARPLDVDQSSSLSLRNETYPELRTINPTIS